MTFAAYCGKGHLTGSVQMPNTSMGALSSYLEDESRLEANSDRRWSKFCIQCGSAVYERCTQCVGRIQANAKYCGGCGYAFPWTAESLDVASDYTSSLEDLSSDEKVKLNKSFRDLTTDSSATTVAANYLRRSIEKVRPAVGSVLIEIAKTLATGEAKKYLGL